MDQSKAQAGRFGAIDRGAPRYNGRPDMPSLAAPGLPQRLFPVAWLGALAVGCTAILDLDHDYVVDGGAGRGGGGVGGRGATGGRSGGGGMDASSTGGMSIDGAVTGGTSGAGGSSGTCFEGNVCGPEEMCCSGSCVAPSPAVGCSSACMPCPPPISNAEPLCAGTVCSAQCMVGFVPAQGGCVPEGTLDAGIGGTVGAGGSGGGSGGAGGTGGASGTGGAPTTCDPLDCPLCSNPALGLVACCDRLTNQCGCSWFRLAYCLE